MTTSQNEKPGGLSLLCASLGALSSAGLLLFVLSHPEYRQQMNPAAYPPRLIAFWCLAELLALCAAVCSLFAIVKASGRRALALLLALASTFLFLLGLAYPLVALAIQILRELSTMKGPGWH